VHPVGAFCKTSKIDVRMPCSVQECISKWQEKAGDSAGQQTEKGWRGSWVVIWHWSWCRWWHKAHILLAQHLPAAPTQCSPCTNEKPFKYGTNLLVLSYSDTVQSEWRSVHVSAQNSLWHSTSVKKSLHAQRSHMPERCKETYQWKYKLNYSFWSSGFLAELDQVLYKILHNFMVILSVCQENSYYKFFWNVGNQNYMHV
jgi:hypothetical protein